MHVDGMYWDHIMMWVCLSYSAWDDRRILISGLVTIGLSVGTWVSLGVILMIRALPGDIG